jgi:lipopolysaccharide transport system permease protein
MSAVIQALLGPLNAFFRHRSLTRELTVREVLGRYRGASFGLLWSLISPFLMLCVYTFAFGTVMGGRWPQPANQQVDFAIILFAGLIVHGFFAECFTRAPTLITSNVNYVKKVIFPIDILPWPMVLSALFHFMMNIIVFLVVRIFLEGNVTWTSVFAPLVIVPLVPFTAGVCWLLAALGVYFRDLSQVSGVLAAALLFLSSAIVPVQNIPEQYRWVFQINPLSYIIDQSREVLVWGHLPDFAGLALYFAFACGFACLGYAWFVLTKRGFADVL